MNKNSKHRPFIDELELKIARGEITLQRLYQVLIEYFDECELAEAELTAQRDTAWKELRIIRETISANPEESTADEVMRVTVNLDSANQKLRSANHLVEGFQSELAITKAELSDAFGDGYYNGFIDGAKHHEDTDCNTKPDYLSDEAMRCSEIAEQEKSTRLGIVSRKELMSQLEVANSMHLDNVRYIWESRNCGSCEELAEKHDQLLIHNSSIKETVHFILSVFTGDNKDEHAAHIDWQAIHDIANKNQIQNLLEHDAKVGRSGFIAGVEARRIALLNDEQAAIKADQYASEIRSGKQHEL